MLYTIGYATKPIDVFIQQLQRHHITAVADVRSVPYSKAFHDYHQEAIRAHLHMANIRYVYLGNELGPRSKDPQHYNDQGQVQFDRLRQSALFNQGVERLKDGMEKGFRIALMCAEKDPASCHRSLLIGYELQRRLNMDLQHITHAGELENQTQLEDRLPDLHSLKANLFESDTDIKQQAYQMQLEKTSYRKPSS